jgi:predicted PurR-regulated permease PerM
MEIFFAAVVALFVQFLKKQMNSTLAIIATCLSLSFVIALVYVYLVDVNLWQSTAVIFAYAGAIYTYVIARFETKDDTSNVVQYDL